MTTIAERDALLQQIQTIITTAQSLSTSIAALPVVITDPLKSLAPGTLLDMGPWADPDPQFNQGSLSTLMMIEDSGLIYDAPRKRIMFGLGGHGLGQTTAFRARNLPYVIADGWYNCTPITPYTELVKSNIDIPGGFYKTTMCPTARHTYRGIHVIGDTLYMLNARGMADTANDLGAGIWGGCVASFNFPTGKWTFSKKWYSTQGMPAGTTLPAGAQEVPWYFGMQSYYDPRLDLIVVAGPSGWNGGSPRVYYYNYKTDDITVGPALTLPGVTPGCGDVIYVPELSKAFLFQNTYGNPTPYKVFQLTIDPTNLQNVQCVLVPVNGTPPCGTWSYHNGLAYDSQNKVIVGMPEYGIMNAFDPFNSTWYQMTMKNGPVDCGLGSAMHCLTYDPDSGATIFLEQRGARNTTWAVKWDKTAATTTTGKPITVGTTSYNTLADAAPFVTSGSTITVAPGTYYGQAVDLSNLNNVTVKSTSGRARFVGGVASYKGTFVVGDGWVFDGIEITNAKGSQLNEAGIRVQGNSLTFRNGYLADNFNGILSNPNTVGQGVVLVEDTVSERNGAGDGQSHNFYIGKHGAFVANRVVSFDANVGHLFKSRAQVTTLTDCRGYEGRASRAIDVPEGGVLTVKGTFAGSSWYKQDDKTNNLNMVGYAMELLNKPITWTLNEIHIDANSILFNSRFGGVYLQTLTGFPVLVDNQAKLGPDPLP